MTSGRGSQGRGQSGGCRRQALRELERELRLRCAAAVGGDLIDDINGQRIVRLLTAAWSSLPPRRRVG